MNPIPEVKRLAHGVDVTVRCSIEGFQDRPALYKIAAPWRGGDLSELKTYAFADDECLEQAYRLAVELAAQVRWAEGEGVGPMCVYKLDAASGYARSERLTDIEARLQAL